MFGSLHLEIRIFSRVRIQETRIGSGICQSRISLCILAVLFLPLRRVLSVVPPIAYFGFIVIVQLLDGLEGLAARTAT